MNKRTTVKAFWAPNIMGLEIYIRQFALSHEITNVSYAIDTTKISDRSQALVTYVLEV